METIAAFIPIAMYWLALHAASTAFTSALYAYRTKSWPPADPFLALAASSISVYMAQEDSTYLAGFLLLVSSFAAFSASTWSALNLKSLKSANPHADNR